MSRSKHVTLCLLQKKCDCLLWLGGLASYFLQMIPGEIRHLLMMYWVMAALMVGKLAQCNDYFNNNKATIIDDD